jgi:2-polyprenyl-3-methyl-5-hydroxy-6-metoxy-1,4-benzoquinol methylase
MAHDEQVKSIIEEHYERNDPLGWFEAVYAASNGSTDGVPWADEKPNSHLVSWLDRDRVVGRGRRAMVTGCGLGDDAEVLSRRGFTVSAFDISPTAIEWAKKRFAKTSVDYRAADLFAVPEEWINAFDFVFEAYTIQALPRSLRAKAVECVSGLVRPGGGDLLVVCRGRENDEAEGTLPWPLSHEEMKLFEANGLARMSFENFWDNERQSEAPIRRFRALFRKR